jgi:hypothetical protein
MVAAQPEVEEPMEDDDETIPVEEVPASPPHLPSPPSSPPVLQAASTSTSTNGWSDDMRELLQQAERLKREARRVEQLYADQDSKTSTQSGASGG